MDIKSSSVRAIYLLGFLALLFSSASALRRERRVSRSSSRQEIRREVRDYLSPPARDASYTSYGPPGFQPPPSLLPYRPGRHLSPPPPPPPRPSTEGPGYFARLASWLNPFGGSPTPPPLPEITVPPYVGKYVPSLSQVSNNYGPPPTGPRQSYGPPSQQPQPQPQPPPPASGSHGYSPPSPKPGENCNPCNVAPWNPLLGPIQEDGYSDAVRTPDFFSPPSAPIPYPHLYPGPMPPLFKAKPFVPPSANFRPTPSDYEGSFGSLPSFAGPGSSDPDPGDGHVDVLPPGAEVDDSGSDAGPPPGYNSPDIRDSPPPGYHGEGWDGGSSLTVEQSKTVHEEHLSTELTAGYKVQGEGGSGGDVEVTKSISTGEYSASVDHPIHYEQSPLIDLTAGRDGKPPSEVLDSGEDGYTAGLNPPSRNEAADSYGVPDKPTDSSAASTVTNGTLAEPTTSYGIPDIGGLPIARDPHGEADKSQLYGAYPPPGQVDSSKDPEGRGVEVVDSYQRQVDQSQEGSMGNPEPLVPYRPSSLYVPFPPYSGPEGASSTSAPDSDGQTTEEPFLEALLKSYNNFKEEMDAKGGQIPKEHGERFRSQENQDDRKEPSYSPSGATTWVSQPQPSFSSPDKISPSVFIAGTGNSPANKQQRSGVKKNKQVQIIIPYTSQYTPGPFRPRDDDWSGRGPLEHTQPRKVPSVGSHEQNYVGEESKSVEIARPLRPVENILINELARKGEIKNNNNKNNSIDVLRLQKNIDNWTIQEYSRGITSSTALPSSSHPYLLPSKIIPNEYLTSTQSSSSSSTENEREIKDNRSTDFHGLNYNDLEHEGAASSRVDVPHIQVLRVEGVTKPVNYRGKFTSESSESSSSSSSSSSSTSSPSPSSSATSTSTSTSTEASWAELPVSISPHDNERVYVVTPQPEGSLNNFFNKLDDRRNYGVVERAYQVLPQAVNNLASTSASGPDASPLWGIMEHDEYARNHQDGVSTIGPPILYSGHSKVSNGSH